MTQEPGPVRAPEFPTGVTWLQGGPLAMAGLRDGQSHLVGAELQLGPGQS